MSLFKKFATVSSGTLLSRAFGFVREMLMAAAVGTGPVADAFNAAFRFPNTFRRLFAEGAFNTAFVPLFSRRIEENGMEEARNFAREVFGVLLSVLFVLTIAMELSMPFLVRWVIAPGFADDAQKFDATVRLAMIMFPYLTCMSLAAMISGMLNSLQRYFAAALAPVFLNIILIAVLAWCWYNNYDVWHIGLALSWGVLVSGIVQLAIVWFALKRAGMSFGLRWPRMSKNVRRLLVLALPAAITGGITQINLLINTNIASSQSGAVSSLVYADRLYQLPLGVVGIAVATVLLPELSRALRGNKQVEANNLQNRSIEFTLFLTLPAAAAFLIMSQPLVSLLYERGQFDAQSTIVVAQLLALYGLGLPAFVLIKALIPGFFAREDTKTPMKYAAISVVVNVAIALTLFPLLSAPGIVIAEITAGWVNVILLFFTLKHRKYFSFDRLLIKRLVRLIIACLIMSACLYGALQYLHPLLVSTSPLYMRILSIMALVFGAMIVYFGTAFALGGTSLNFIKQSLKRRQKTD